MNHFWSVNAYNFQSFVLAEGATFLMALAPDGGGAAAAYPSSLMCMHSP